MMAALYIFVIAKLPGNNPPGWWITISILSVASLGMLVHSINMGLRRGAVAIAGDRLLIVQKGMFGKKEREWDRDQIRQVRAVPSASRINNVPVLELRILTHDKKKTGFFSSLGNDELQWLAQTIKAGLKSLPS